MTDYRSLLEHDLRVAGSAGFSLDDLARRRDRKRRNQRIGTAALALILVAATTGILLRSFRVDPAPRPAGLPSTPGLWSRHELEATRTSTMIAGGPGLVAVGWDERGAAAWTSSDGLTWARVPSDLGVGTINDVTTGASGLVAVGTTGNELLRIAGRETAAPSHAVVWTSEDGFTWTRHPEDPVFRGAGFEPSAVTAGGPGVVAVGGNAAWFSSDGTTWERATVPPVPEGVYPGDDGKHPQVWMTDVTASGDYLVANGWKMMNDNSELPVIWTSTDGKSWTDVTLDPEIFPRGGDIAAVASGPSGFVAVGHENLDGPAVWTSADGLRWHRVPDLEAFASRVPSPGTTFAMWSVAASEDGYVAVGTDGLCEHGGACRSAEAAIWTSPDGESWSRVAPGDEFRVVQPEASSTGASAFRVVSWGSRFVVEGEYDGRDAIWISGASA